jgi:hypothetical protein
MIWWNGNPLVLQTTPGVPAEQQLFSLKTEAAARQIAWLDAIAGRRSERHLQKRKKAADEGCLLNANRRRGPRRPDGSVAVFTVRMKGEGGFEKPSRVNLATNWSP